MGNTGSRSLLKTRRGKNAPSDESKSKSRFIGRKSSMGSTTSTVKSDESPKSRSSKSKSRKKKRNPVNFKWEPAASTALTPSAQAAYNFCLFANQTEVKKCEDLFDVECDWKINNTEGDPLYMKIKDVLAVTFNFWRSFPNCGYGWDEVIDLGDNKAKIVGIRWFGHHTGEPFAFDPYPPIEAKGTYVEDGPLDMICTIDPESGKIVLVDSYGTNSGPHGTYNALGGFLVDY